MAKDSNMLKAQKTVQIDSIFEELQPNAYVEEHAIWNKLDKAFRKLSMEELRSLKVVLWCKTETPVLSSDVPLLKAGLE